MDLSELGIDIENINIKIKDKFIKVLNGELESFQISDINNFSFYLDIINSFLDDPFKVSRSEYQVWQDELPLSHDEACKVIAERLRLTNWTVRKAEQ
jgi:hypothetical protein